MTRCDMHLIEGLEQFELTTQLFASDDPDLQRVIDALRQRLQTRVKIQGDGKRGRIEIEYFGDEDLTRLTGILLGDA